VTERKPEGVSFETWVEKQIRDAQARGDFDALPGAGKPLPGAGVPDQDDWWVRELLRRGEADTEAMLPPEMLLRKEIERLPQTVRGLDTEAEVRSAVEAINAQVRQSWRGPAGAGLPVRLVNVDAIVRVWQDDRAAAPAVEPVGGSPREAAAPPDSGRRPGRGAPWWRRMRRRGRGV
jgi:hypothetical protein